MTREELMSPEAQRIAIATACGWTDIAPCTCRDGVSHGFPPEYSAHRKHLPDYLSDLNAMHEAEMSLRPINQERYYRLLREKIGSYDLAISATAAQRAEAFLRTLNLWTE